MLELVIVGGPQQRILCPAEIEDQTLAERLEQSALYGKQRLFERSIGITSGLDGADLVIRQERGASIRLTEHGSVVVRIPLDEPRAPFLGMLISPMFAAFAMSASSISVVTNSLRLRAVRI